MGEMKRIDPKAVPGLFQRLGLKPVKATFGTRDECGCVLTACMVDGGVTDTWEVVERLRGGEIFLDSTCRELGARLKLHPRYCIGLIYGWDGEDCSEYDPDEEREGHADGRAAWLACVESGLVEPTS